MDAGRKKKNCAQDDIKHQGSAKYKIKEWPIDLNYINLVFLEA